jgi:hypothetical protein
MNTQQLKDLIGPITAAAIVAHRFGDAALHASGYVTADPCYILDEPTRDQFRQAVRALALSRRDALDRWHAVELRGKTCFIRDTGGDGVGFFGHCVDSGSIAAVPIELCNLATQQAFPLIAA